MGVKALTTGLFALSSLSAAYATLDSSFFKLFDTIEKDVVIVGGGASGSHAAVRLREDYGKSVVVIEKEALLVSHTHL
jgi:ribulose 1,5-bisphosphate synthetase/thiazole synthase